jgi:hypothetical protein
MIGWKVPTRRFLRPIGTMTVRVGAAELRVRAAAAHEHEPVAAQDPADLVGRRAPRHFSA